MEGFASSQHLDNRLDALDLRFWAPGRLQSIGNRVEIGLAECFIKSAGFLVARQRTKKFLRHGCVGL